jgi:DNA-binding NtrC family response regulator
MLPLRPYRDEKRDFEREYCLRALRLCGGNVALAARIAQMERRSFYDLMQRTGARRPEPQAETEVPAA